MPPTANAPAPHPHRSLLQRVEAGLESRPDFELVEPGSPEGIVLRAALALAGENDLDELDADREHVATNWGQFSGAWHCSVHARTSEGREHELCANWSPVGPHDDPRTGFGDGPDSALLGHFPRTIMPDDWRTEALLMLLTTPFEHLSVERRAVPPLVRGVQAAGLTGHRYLELES